MTRLPRFETTLWSEVARAGDQSRNALDSLLRRYRAPILVFLLTRGLQSADAEDLTQEVFQRLLQSDVLAKADREKGKFRSLLLGVTRNVLREGRKRLHALKRGGGATNLPLDPDLDDPAIADASASPCEDGVFDRIWISHLIDDAIRLAQEADQARGTQYMEVLTALTVEDLTYEQLAQRFGLELHDVRNYVHRARREIGRQIGKLVESYSSSVDEYQAELRYVSDLIGGARKGRPRLTTAGESGSA